MIPVTLKLEPANFDTDVRQKGRAWLQANNIALDTAPPEGTKLKPYWQATNRQLWKAYSGGYTLEGLFWRHFLEGIFWMAYKCRMDRPVIAEWAVL